MNQSVRVALSSLAAVGALLAAAHSHAGIEEPGKIDAVASKPDAPYVILLMTSALDWNERTFAMVEKKVANYLEFIKSGQLVQGRPTAEGKKVRVILAHEVTPNEEFKAKLAELRNKVEVEGIQFLWGGRHELAALAGAP